MRPEASIRKEPGIEYSALNFPSISAIRPNLPVHHTHKRTGLNRQPLLGVTNLETGELVEALPTDPNDSSFFNLVKGIKNEHPVYGDKYKHVDEFGDWNFKEMKAAIPVYRYGEPAFDQAVAENNDLYRQQLINKTQMWELEKQNQY